MLDVERTNQFKRDFKLSLKRGKNLHKLEPIIEALVALIPLPAKHRPHKLVGNYEGLWECHVEPDFLLIYGLTEDCVILYRLGTHADLF